MISEEKDEDEEKILVPLEAQDFCICEKKKGREFEFWIQQEELNELLFFTQYPADKMKIPYIQIKIGFCRNCLKPLNDHIFSFAKEKT